MTKKEKSYSTKTLTLDNDILDQMEAIAITEGRSLSKQINRALREWIEKQTDNQ